MGGGSQTDLTDPFLGRPPADQFRHFARLVGDEVPLYGLLSREIAEDRELLSLTANTLPGQPAPNLLFGAVRLLLIRDSAHPLAGPFASGDFPEDIFQAFRRFCLDRRQQLEEIIRSHRTQTNEVGRAAGLLPAIALAAGRAGTRIGLVEIGASAGLLLHLDRFRYDYGEGNGWGEPSSPVRVKCQLRGKVPITPEAQLSIVTRAGVDLHPLDPTRSDDADWLLALVWPGHTSRFARLEAALELARENPASIVAGNAIDELDGLLADVPSETTPVLLHSFSLIQWSRDEREALSRRLRGAARPIFRVWLEWFTAAGQYPELRLFSYRDGREESVTLGAMHHHGAWLDWR